MLADVQSEQEVESSPSFSNSSGPSRDTLRRRKSRSRSRARARARSLDAYASQIEGVSRDYQIAQSRDYSDLVDLTQVAVVTQKNEDSITMPIDIVSG